MPVTNAIEGLNVQLRKIIKTQGHFPNDEAAIKLLWLELRNVLAKSVRAAFDWKAAMNQFVILFGNRFTQARGLRFVQPPRTQKCGQVLTRLKSRSLSGLLSLVGYLAGASGSVTSNFAWSFHSPRDQTRSCPGGRFTSRSDSYRKIATNHLVFNTARQAQLNRGTYRSNSLLSAWLRWISNRHD